VALGCASRRALEGASRRALETAAALNTYGATLPRATAPVAGIAGTCWTSSGEVSVGDSLAPLPRATEPVVGLDDAPSSALPSECRLRRSCCRLRRESLAIMAFASGGAGGGAAAEPAAPLPSPGS
jgi:hypothetical protein